MVVVGDVHDNVDVVDVVDDDEDPPQVIVECLTVAPANPLMLHQQSSHSFFSICIFN